MSEIYLSKEKILARFFSKADWVSAFITFSISLIVYTLTLQPTVGLEDSGELIVASDYLGVPHPPGYPIWTLLTWFFQWIFHAVTFHGQPNPAWGVNWFSAFCGALACGIITMLISRSGKDLIENFKWENNSLDKKTKRLFCNAAGISGGLLLAFGQGMWSQAVIAEVYTLNIMFQSLVLIFLYQWMMSSNKNHWLLLCSFIFGLGITNHQTLLFMGLAIAFAVAFKDIKLFLKFFVVGFFYILLVIIHKLLPTESRWLWTMGPEYIGFWFWSIYIFIVPILGLALLSKNDRFISLTFILLFLGLSFYFYMPFASDQNPPINWGYPRTWDGFMHAITRGQYERVTLAAVFSSQFLQQISSYWMDLRSQFYGPIALLAAIPIFYIWRITKRNLSWMITTLIAFLSVGIVFMILQNPKTDIQNLFIGRVQYIQSHAIYVIWLGYGILFIMAGLQSWVKNNIFTKVIGTILVLLLPFSLIYKNYYDQDQLIIVGGAEQNGHDFGWQFGNWQLRGIEGIKSDFQYWYPNLEDFEKQWATYPCTNYPLPMETNAIFFGGTDPGRFVPTYMIYSAKVRPDIYLITQNALADNTYMNVMRDLYGDQIWIPTEEDSGLAFAEYVQAIQRGEINDGASITTEGGRVQIQGVAGVMQINAKLCKQIFDNNKLITEMKTDEKNRPTGSAVVYNLPSNPPLERSFYIEESYPMQWMYPYLTPHGLIMKLNNNPTEITPELIEQDTLFWNWYSNRLLSDEKFIRDIVARKSFSKLRTAIAGLYEARGLYAESEIAYKQAIKLYDLSPEANYKLANLLGIQNRFAEAKAFINDLHKKDVNNDKLLELINQLELHERRVELEKNINQNDFDKLFELYTIYDQLNIKEQSQKISSLIIKNIKYEKLPSFIEDTLQKNHEKIGNQAIEYYLSSDINNIEKFITIADILLRNNFKDYAYEIMKICINYNGYEAINKFKGDQRLQTLKDEFRFKQMLIPKFNNQNKIRSLY